MNDVILNIQDLKTYFFTDQGIVKAVDGVSLDIRRGEVIGVVGESGCGKSMTFMSVMKLIQYPGKILDGKIMFQNEDIIKKSEAEMVSLRGRKISMIFQDPLTALNPVLTIGDQISETILSHQLRDLQKNRTVSQRLMTFVNPIRRRAIKKEARQKALEMLDLVKIPSPFQRLGEYPFQFSGGMRQRVVIATALACDPAVLIADEPTTALDVTIQAQILDLLNNIKQKLGMSLILITHDFGIARELCDRIAVMYAGKIVESAPTNQLIDAPKHPYTSALLNCMPDASKKKIHPIPGMVASLINVPPGCSFHPRCGRVLKQCRQETPLLKEIDGRTVVRCHLYD